MHWLFWLALIALTLVLGPADDEAYYWAISLPFKWGFAYHPPGVLWSIALVRGWLGDGAGCAGTLVLRLPNLLFAWGTWRLALRLVPTATRTSSAILLLTALPALWGAAWMAVPDWGLVFFTTLLMVAIMERGLPGRRALLMAGIGACGVLLFKLSGLLAVGSAVLAVAGFKPRERIRFLAAIGMGALVGVFPFVFWNATHDWGALNYQVMERHGGFEGVGSLVRFGRFWLLTLLLVGPAAVFAVVEAVRARAWKWLIWVLPPLLIFGLQPFWGEFKLHWIWIAFWPAVIGVLAQTGRDLRARAVVRRMSAYGVGLILAVWILLTLPWISWLKPGAPLLDPGADLVGYEQVPAFLVTHAVAGLPVVAARYQVAGQLAFALRNTDAVVTELPVDSRERADWPELDLLEGSGRLKRSVVYFADERYSAGPPQAWGKCSELGTILPRRALFGPLGGPVLPGKWIRAWRCDPAQ